MANKYLDYNGLDYFWDKIDNKKQNKLTAGSNITISGDTISASQPTVNNGQLTIQKNGSNVQTFTANQSGNVTADIVTDELKRKSDTRSSMKPSDANFASSATLHFTTVGALDSQTQSGGYADALMLNSWSNNSGGRVNALVATKQNDQKLYHYTGTFNGSSWSGKKELAYADEYLPLTGGILTGNVGINGLNTTSTSFNVKHPTSGTELFFGVGSGGVNHGIWSTTLNKWMLYGDATSVNLNGNAATATSAGKLTTARTIGISGGATGTDTSFNGTSNISIPVTKLYETYLDWGNQVKNSSVSLIDAAMGEDFSANRLAYLPASCITIEYSRDAGATWTAYTATDAQKIGLVTTSQSFYTGGTSTLESGTTRLRITIAPGSSLYMTTRKLLVNISTGGVENAQMIIEKRAIGAEDFTVVRGATTITGWSGWNSFPLNIAYGGTSSWSNDAIRLTFFFDGKSASYPNAQLNVSRIRLFGETAWSAPSNLAKNGHMYTYDTAQNVTFPATVKATFFDGPTKYAQYLEGNGRITSANLDHFTANNDVHQRLDIVSSSMSAANGKPAGDGFLTTYTWDNSGNYDTQVYHPNAIGANGGRPQIRFKAGTSSTFNWSSWKSLAYLDDVPTVPTNVSAFTNDAGYLTSIPTASASTLGGIKVGSNLSIDANGVLSAQTGSSYSAGNHIDITNGVISAEDYVHSEDPVSTGSITPVVTNGMVANGTLTASKFASGELLTLTMSTTDIGEGAALAANTLYGVYD